MSIIVRPTSLRDTLILKYNIVSVYRNILEHADLPYSFDELNKPWWRFYGELYGFSYSRVHRSYDLWVSNGLKRNIRLYMPLLMKMPPGRLKTTITWKKRRFLYLNTTKDFNLVIWTSPRYFKKINLTLTNLYTSTKEAIYYNFPGNSQHFAINPSGIYGQGNESVFSAFNGKWHSSNNHYAGFYKLKGLAPTSNFMGINDNYISTSFFINLYDTTLILYIQNYLNYYNQIYRKKIAAIISPYFFKIINNWIFNYKDNYNNILLNFYNVLYEMFLQKINSYLKYYLDLSSFSKLKYRLNLFYLIYYFKKFYYIYDHNNILLRYNYFNIFICISYFFNISNNFSLNKSIKNIFNYSNENNLNYISYLNYILYPDIFNNLNRKNKKFDILNLKKIKFNRKKYLSFIYKNTQSLGFINYYRSSWTFKFLIFLKKKYFKNKFLRKFSTFLFNRKSFYIYKFKFSTKFSKLYLKKKYNLGIKRILNYGKLFLRTPSFIMKRRWGYSKLSSLIASNTLFRTFLFPYFNKITYKNISDFISSAFSIISFSIKFNFGFSYSCYGLVESNNLNINSYYYLNIQYYLSKFFIFFNKFLRRKNNNLYKKNFFYYKLLLNMLTYKITKKNIFYIKNIFSSKLKYLNYCYKGLSLKLFSHYRKK